MADEAGFHSSIRSTFAPSVVWFGVVAKNDRPFSVDQRQMLLSSFPMHFNSNSLPFYICLNTNVNMLEFTAR